MEAEDVTVLTQINSGVVNIRLCVIGVVFEDVSVEREHSVVGILALL